MFVQTPILISEGDGDVCNVAQRSYKHDNEHSYCRCADGRGKTKFMAGGRAAHISEGEAVVLDREAVESTIAC